MSERSAALGIKGPPKTIEHNGRVYTIAPVLTEGTMLRIETHLYERAKTALVELRNDYPEAEYVKRLDELRKRREEGAFSFESCAEELGDLKGAAVLLGCMMDATPDEILNLLTERSAEMQELLNEVMVDSFPEGAPPKARALPRKGKRNRR